MLNDLKRKIQNNRPHILGHEQMQKYAVTIPIIQNEDDSLSVVLEKRASSLRRQPNEISFPGGKVEKTDQNISQAAIRETVEELGINYQDVELIGELDTYVHLANIIIYPFVVQLKTSDFQPNPTEVDKLLLVPLAYLLTTKPKEYKIFYRIEPEQAFPFHLIPGGKNYPWRNSYKVEKFYFYNDEVIWGMTARILEHFINLIINQ